MGITTVESAGTPWVICSPSDSGDLDRFLAASASTAGIGALTTRAATPQEANKWAAAHALHVFNGGNADAFFGIAV
jgi:hypothetical protein